MPPKLNKNLARNLSYALGGLALVMLVASAILLAVVRDRSTVVTTVIPSTSGPPVSRIPLPPVQVGIFNGNDSFTVEDFIVAVSPVASVGDVSLTVSGNDSTPVFGPGLLPFGDTTSRPLQSPSEGFGYLAMLPDASQFFTSMENGLSIYGQYNYTTIDSDSKFRPDTDAYASNLNIIFFDCVETGKKNPVNTDASAVGCVGHYSIATSTDGIRLYVAYRQPFMGSSPTSGLFPFLQLIGRVAVFTRPIDVSQPGDPTSNSVQWTYACELSLQNPFGSQVGSFDGLCDPVTRMPLLSDDFGSVIKTSKNLTNRRRITAVRANYGFQKANGAVIAVYEETNSEMQVTSGILQLWDYYKPGFDPNKPGSGWSLDEKLSFGRSFDVGNDALLASVRVPSERCDGSTGPAVNRVAYFKRNETTRQWNFKHFIETPDKTEDFGVSIVLGPDGDMAIIGAPKFPTGFGEGHTPGIGGSVYVYARSGDGETWRKTQKYTDPLADKHTGGAFGYWVSVDRQFLVVAISANQNNTLGVTPRRFNDIDKPARPSLVFANINQISNMIVSSPTVPEEPQPALLDSYYADPTYGANLAMSFEDSNAGGDFRIAFNTPLNQYVVVRGLST